MPRHSWINKGVGLFLALSLTACASNLLNTPSGDPAEFFSADRLRKDIAYLADDSLKGRETGTEGYEKAADYVAAAYQDIGIKPAGENESYFQQVPFRSATLDLGNTHMTVTVEGQTYQLKLGDDFFMSGSIFNPDGEVEAPIVFVGYGIHAPDLGHDDLEGLDVEGKIVLVLSGAPKAFHTEVRAHHGSAGTKVRELLERGAVGFLSVNTTEDEKRRPFAKLKRFLGEENVSWMRANPDMEQKKFIQASASISQDIAHKLFAGAEKSFTDVLKEADAGSPSGFALNASAHIRHRSKVAEPFESPNVLGVIEGSDPYLKQEYVVLSAHLDHVGVTPSAKGDDKINNGALDNASGVAVMLEVARAVAASNRKPKRSLLFLASTGEEKGLLGADYFARHPTVKKRKIVANVNLDMPILLYDFTDIVAFGAERSSLGRLTEKAVVQAGVTLSPDPMPEEGVFTRSDHYRFVTQGIPSVFLVTGWGKTVDGEDGGAIFRNFLEKYYHTPADEIDLPIDYDAGAKFAYVNWLIVKAIADTKSRPKWNKGDFFGRTFGPKTR